MILVMKSVFFHILLIRNMNYLLKESINLLIIFLVNFQYISKFLGYLSWSYGFYYQDQVPSLVHKLYIRWWAKFNSSISLDLPPRSKSNFNPILTELVATSTQKESPLMNSDCVLAASPLMLSPSLSQVYIYNIYRLKRKSPTYLRRMMSEKHN